MLGWLLPIVTQVFYRLEDMLDEPGLQRPLEGTVLVVMVGREASVAIERANMLEGIRVW